MVTLLAGNALAVGIHSVGTLVAWTQRRRPVLRGPVAVNSFSTALHTASFQSREEIMERRSNRAADSGNRESDKALLKSEVKF